MDQSGWVIVRNWDRFQHYGRRDPIWVKVYTQLLHDDDWLSLTLTERGLLVTVWLEYARSNGVLRASRVRSMVHRNVRERALDSLLRAGFIEVSASKPLALTRARVEEEKEEEVEPPYPHRSGGTVSRSEGTNPRAVAKRDRPRRKAERWIDNGLAAEVPPEHLADVLADEFGIHDPEQLAELIAYANGRVESIP